MVGTKLQVALARMRSICPDQHMIAATGVLSLVQHPLAIRIVSKFDFLSRRLASSPLFCTHGPSGKSRAESAEVAPLRMAP
jgi:hypothetical protein